MKAETAATLALAQEALVKAELMLANAFPDEAGRHAYLAGMHAPRAFLFERYGLVVKTHSGTQSEFTRRLRNMPGFSEQERRFLGQYLPVKLAVDYGKGTARPLDALTGRLAIDRARDLLAAVQAALSPAPEKDPA